MVLFDPLITLLVRVWLSDVPTTAPAGIAFCAAAPSIAPLLFDSTKLLAAMPLTVLLSTLIVLPVRVWLSDKPTTALLGKLIRFPFTASPESSTFNLSTVPVAIITVFDSELVPDTDPSMMLLDPVVTDSPACLPKNMLFDPVVLAAPALDPIKLL